MSAASTPKLPWRTLTSSSGPAPEYPCTGSARGSREEYLQPGATPAETLEATGHLALSTVYAVGPAGKAVVTAFEVLRGIEPSAHVLALEDTAGRVHCSEAGVCTVQAGIDQETLGTGKRAEFFLDFNLVPIVRIVAPLPRPLRKQSLGWLPRNYRAESCKEADQDITWSGRGDRI